VATLNQVLAANSQLQSVNSSLWAQLAPLQQQKEQMEKREHEAELQKASPQPQPQPQPQPSALESEDLLLRPPSQAHSEPPFRQSTPAPSGSRPSSAAGSFDSASASASSATSTPPRPTSASIRVKSPLAGHTLSSISKAQPPVSGGPGSSLFDNVDVRPPFYPPPVLSHTHGSKMVHRAANTPNATAPVVVVPPASLHPISYREESNATVRRKNTPAVPPQRMALDRNALNVAHFKTMDRERVAPSAAAGSSVRAAAAAGSAVRKPFVAPKHGPITKKP
jgi:hypothetical protein